MSKYIKAEKLEDIRDDGDVVVIHLGKVLPEDKYNDVVQSIVAFMNARWPEFTNNRFSN